MMQHIENAPDDIARVRAITTDYILILVNSIIAVSRISASYLRGYAHMAKRHIHM
jgi:hypothetical protein